MGILKMMLGADSPVAMWADQNRGWKGAIGAGLAAGPTFEDGLAKAAQLGVSGQQADEAYQVAEAEKAERQKQINQTAEYLRQTFPDLSEAVNAGMPLDAAWNEAMKRNQPGYGQAELTADQRNYQFSQANPGFMDFLNQGAGTAEYGLTPIWGRLPDGSFGYGVQGKDGSFRRVDTGDLDPLDPRSLNYEKGYGGSVGKAAGEATAAAPGDIAAGMAALDIIDQIKTSPELGWATGTSAGMGGNAIPGTGRFGFQNLVDQAKSGAFLTAVQEMRGLGALSNAEGSAATQAITRINTALSKEDFLKALADYEAIVQRGIARAQARISGGAQGQQQTAPGGQTSTGLQWSVEP